MKTHCRQAIAAGRPAAALGLALWLGAAFVGGCKPCPTQLHTLEQLVQAHNQAVLPLANVRSRATIGITLVQPDRLPLRTPTVEGNLLLARNPSDPAATPFFLLRGQELTQELFRLGTDLADGSYYFWYDFAGRSGAWSGRLDKLDHPPSQQDAVLLMDPTQLINVLGILPMAADMENPPVLLRAERKTCQYVLQFVARRGGGGFYVQREVHIDRRDPAHRPSLVKLYDRFSRVAAIAHLGDYRPAVMPDGQEGPYVPTRIDMDWPAYPDDVLSDKPTSQVNIVRPASLRLRLIEPHVVNELPPAVFRMVPPAGVPVIQIDDLSRENQ